MNQAWSRHQKARGQLPASVRAALPIPHFIFISEESWSCKTALGETVNHTALMDSLTFENVTCDAPRKGSLAAPGSQGRGWQGEARSWLRAGRAGSRVLPASGTGRARCLSRVGPAPTQSQRCEPHPPSVPSTWGQASGVPPAFAPCKTCHLHPWQVSSPGSGFTGLEASEFVKLK